MLVLISPCIAAALGRGGPHGRQRLEDQDLFELAALAAGARLVRFDPAAQGFVLEQPEQLCAPDCNIWNPRDDDGDALRLALRLGMRIDCGRRNEFSATASAYAPGYMGDEIPHDGQPQQALRLVIFHTAVEIGLSLSETTPLDARLQARPLSPVSRGSILTQ